MYIYVYETHTNVHSLHAQLKCPELEDDAFEQRRVEMQQFKSAIKNLSAHLPQWRTNVKNMTAPLESLNSDIVRRHNSACLLASIVQLR